MPPASAAAPLSVVESCTFAPSFLGELDSAVEMPVLAQVEAWNGTGAMKSYNSALVDEPEEHAFTMIEQYDWHVS